MSFLLWMSLSSIWWGVGLMPGPAALLAEVRVLSSTACIVAIVFSRAALRLESVLLSQAVDKAVKRSPYMEKNPY